LYSLHIYPVCTTCPAHLILLDLVQRLHDCWDVKINRNNEGIRVFMLEIKMIYVQCVVRRNIRQAKRTRDYVDKLDIDRLSRVIYRLTGRQKSKHTLLMYHVTGGGGRVGTFQVQSKAALSRQMYVYRCCYYAKYLIRVTCL